MSLVEVLVALAITALLLTATAMAFDAAFENYKSNHNLALVSIYARNALYQMCSNIRASWNAPDKGDPTEVSADGTECSFTDQNGRLVIYRYFPDSHQIKVNIDAAAQWYIMVDNVTPLTAGDHIFSLTPPSTPGFPAGTAGRVEIRFTVTHEGASRSVSAATVPCNVLYAK
jgi:hypothetical protein